MGPVSIAISQEFVLRENLHGSDLEGQEKSKPGLPASALSPGLWGPCGSGRFLPAVKGARDMAGKGMVPQIEPKAN